MMLTNAERPTKEGFSLIEALVALAILTGTLSVTLLVLSSNTERSARATAHLRAVLAAEAILNRVGLDIPLQAQTVGGQLSDGSKWRVHVALYAEPGLINDRQPPLLSVEVTITPKRWSTEGVRLKTLKISGVAE